MTSTYSLAKFLTSARKHKTEVGWHKIIESLRELERTAHMRGCFDLALRTKGTSSDSPVGKVQQLKVWLSTLPWEIENGLNRYPETGMGGNKLQESTLFLPHADSTTSFCAQLDYCSNQPHGMLFYHDKPSTYQAPHVYWISKVEFDLDLAMYSASGEILGSFPQGLRRGDTERVLQCPQGTQYVLETQKGVLPAQHSAILCSAGDKSFSGHRRVRYTPPLLIENKVVKKSSSLIEYDFDNLSSNMACEIALRRSIDAEVIRPLNGFLTNRDALVSFSPRLRPRWLIYRTTDPSRTQFTVSIQLLRKLNLTCPTFL